MVGGNAAKKGKRRRGAKTEVERDGSSASAALAATAAPARPAAGVKAAAVLNGTSTDAIDKKKGKKKSKREREQPQAPETEGETGGVDGTSSSRDVPRKVSNRETTKDTKRRKKGGRLQPHAPESAAAAAAVAAVTPGVCAADSPQLPASACTSKVAEFTATCCTTSPNGARKSKRKLKKDKRQKTGGRFLPSHNRHAPPLSENTTPPSDVDDPNDDSHESSTLEGIFHEGAMYLVDVRRRVFSAQRDEQGNLVQVGTFDDDRGKVVIIVKPTLDAPTNGNSSLAVAVKGAVPSKGAPDNTSVSGAAGSRIDNKTKNKGKKEAGAGVRGEEEGDATGTTAGNVVEYPFEVEVGPKNIPEMQYNCLASPQHRGTLFSGSWGGRSGMSSPSFTPLSLDTSSHWRASLFPFAYRVRC